ncbi:MAG: hypothetical protein GY737_26415 [Desulfobacteraceae bacterium]|nr:hypothetical protein [Desulfobacteraceae bacterium]
MPCLKTGHLTFGSFNNTAKYNAGVFEVWATILKAVPDSRLVLKWRTFNDDGFVRSVRRAFTDLGIPCDRIELRGPSFHADMLKEYADIDIALDPFPFTGGLTSCEAAGRSFLLSARALVSGGDYPIAMFEDRTPDVWFF